MDKFVIVSGGTKKQRELVHNITDWFCDKFFSRFKSYNIEFDLCKIEGNVCLLYTSPSPRDAHESRMPSSA